MPTPAGALAAVAAALEAQLVGIARLGSDYRDDLERLPAGARRYQLRGGVAGETVDSNATRQRLALELRILHALADPAAERAYTEGALLDAEALLLSRAFWRGIAGLGLDEIEDGPSYRVERTGRIVALSVTLTVSILP